MPLDAALVAETHSWLPSSQDRPAPSWAEGCTGACRGGEWRYPSSSSTRHFEPFATFASLREKNPRLSAS